jgi:alpha-tubulin suppressor-like RCC1 family protein
MPFTPPRVGRILPAAFCRLPRIAAAARFALLAGVLAGDVFAAAPVILVPPQASGISFRENAVLSVQTAGAGVTLQWYAGVSGDVSAPVSGAKGALLVSPPLTDTTSFWVRASNQDGSTDSPAAVVSVAAPFRGTLYSCGLNHVGQLGIGSNVRSLSFQPVATDVSGVAANIDESFFFKADGTFWGTGENSNGELGDGFNVDRNQPVVLGTGIVAVATRGGKSYFLKADGSLWGSSSGTPSPAKIGDGFACIDAGGTFCMAVKTDGSLWGEGGNSSGQLGQGNYDSYSSFVKIEEGVVRVAAGYSHTLFIKRDGSLWGMGSASGGQLGVPGISSTTNVPVQIEPSGVTRIAGGRSRSIFLKVDGSCWGMGSGLNPGSEIPAQIASDVTDVGAGDFHAIFLKANHELWVVGANSQGQLGDGTTTTHLEPFLARAGVVAFSSGYQHSLIVEGRPLILQQPLSHPVTTGLGSLLSASAGSNVPVTWQWYRGLSGDTSSPIVGAVNAVYQIPALNESGHFWARATNPYGYTDTAAAFVEAVVHPAIDATPVDPVVMHGEHATLPVSASGGALTYSWYEGEPGDTSKSVAAIQRPTLVTRPLRAPVTYWVRVSNVAGSVDSTAIPISISPSEASYLKTSGLNFRGQLGDGTTTTRPLRVQVASRVRQVIGGVFNTYFLKDDGTLWGAGYNHVGQLGRPPTTTETLPVQIASEVIDVVAGNVFILFIKSDGSLWGLGYNNHGQLGTGNWTSRNVPFQIASDVVQAAGGEGHSVFLKSDGSAWAMGRDTDGELGNGAAVNGDVLVPMQIAIGVASVAAGEHYTMLIKSDGSLWAAGSNSSGQFGDGSKTSQAAPVQVGIDVLKVACGDDHTLICKIDGTLWTCGTNDAGQLGNGVPSSSQATPVMIAPDVEFIAAGVDYSMFITRERQLYGMGASSFGQLGDGILSARTSPVLLGKAYAVACGDSHSAVLDGRPMITTPPVPTTVEVGQSVELTVNAMGPGPLSYQWYRGEAGDGSQPVDGAITSSFNTGPLLESGSYWVRVANPYGEESSLAATLAVIDLGSPAYLAWAESKGLSGNQRDTRADLEGDGWSNLLEYAFAGNPVVPGDPIHTVTVGPGESGPNLVLVHRRAMGAAVTFTYEWSPDLVAWQAFTPQISVLPEDSQAELVTASRPIAAGERSGFVRVRVSGN